MINELTGIVIDPSHGGLDYGSTSKSGLSEKDISLESSIYMYNRLKELGVPVKIIRTTDETINPDERIRRVKEAFGDRPGVVSITNAVNTGTLEGAEVLYSVRDTNSLLANNILNQLASEGQIPLGAYQKSLPFDSNQDFYFLMRNLNKIKPIVIEYGYVDNQNDQKKIKNNLLNYTEAAVRGIALTYDIPYTPPRNLELNTYIVKKDDTLYSIAQQFNTTTSILKGLNNLESNIIYVGQTLKLPKEYEQGPEYINTIFYTVKRDDSLYSIAESFGIDYQDIINANQLGSINLEIGQNLLIPLNEIKEQANISEIIYFVKEGDTIDSIAKKFDVAPNNLIKYNNLETSLLNINQQLLIPKKEEYTKYFVKTGDNISNIARRFNTTIEEILKVNDLNTIDLEIGQLLIIP